MKMIRVQDAIGTILSHDVTQIIPGEFKGRLINRKRACICMGTS